MSDILVENKRRCVVNEHFTDTFSVNIFETCQHFLIMSIENILWSASQFLQDVFAVAN